MTDEQQPNSNGDAHAHSGAGETSETPELTTWGVGPWQGERPQGAGTDPNSPFDPELLANGDTRNVLDHYRY